MHQERWAAAHNPHQCMMHRRAQQCTAQQPRLTAVRTMHSSTMYSTGHGVTQSVAVVDWDRDCVCDGAKVVLVHSHDNRPYDGQDTQEGGHAHLEQTQQTGPGSNNSSRRGSSSTAQVSAAARGCTYAQHRKQLRVGRRFEATAEARSDLGSRGGGGRGCAL